MPFIPTKLDEVIEPKPAPTDFYDLQVTDAREMESGPNSKHPGSPMIAVSIGFPNHTEYQTFTHFVNFPHPNDDASASNYKLLMLKRLLRVFNVPYAKDGIDTARLCMDITGATANLEVGISEYQGRINNTLVLPPIPEGE